jgi:hypothetical protein
MSGLAVISSDVILDAEILETRTARRRRLKSARLADPVASQSRARGRRQIDQLRFQVVQIVCSGAWADDCLYRGAVYFPNFSCRCAHCRLEFADRLYPRQARQSNYSSDCQVEMDEDPEFAEEFAVLRNDRARAGSVFLSVHRTDRGSGTFRRSQLGGTAAMAD